MITTVFTMGLVLGLLGMNPDVEEWKCLFVIPTLAPKAASNSSIMTKESATIRNATAENRRPLPNLQLRAQIGPMTTKQVLVLHRYIMLSQCHFQNGPKNTPIVANLHKAQWI